MKKGLYYGILAVLAAVFLFSAYKIGDYLLEKHRSDQILDHTSKFVTVEKDTDHQENSDEAPEMVVVDFQELHKMNSDIVGWLYCADTKINYPVVQTSDNEYYLHRLLDGSWNANGTIFMDYRNSADMSDRNTIIYGHNMKSGAMFGQLGRYKNQGFYDEHPYLYYITESKTYRLDLLAGCIVDSTDSIYSLDPNEENIGRCMAHSTFAADKEYQGGPIVTLSTCTYEYDDARFIVLGELVKEENSPLKNGSDNA